jgi:hypothetical protein
VKQPASRFLALTTELTTERDEYLLVSPPDIGAHARLKIRTFEEPASAVIRDVAHVPEGVEVQIDVRQVEEKE